MPFKVLIIGGYGNFGSFISKSLSSEAGIQLFIGGRSIKKAREFCAGLSSNHQVKAVVLDINRNLGEVLKNIQPQLIIHTSGPFQTQGYQVAELCIELGIHYVDLADAREFVVGIDTLDESAKKHDVCVYSGASSVPCLTSAIVDHYQSEFDELIGLDYGITTAQKTTRGLATTAAILNYTGKVFHTLIGGDLRPVYGWQSLHGRRYSDLGWRLLGNCDVPDLSIFPNRYPGLKNQRFYAGLELPFVHLTLWLLSWLVRVGLIKNLAGWARALLKISFLFDFAGSANSGFHMKMMGKKQGLKKNVSFELIARGGDGPYIPCMPAILIAKKLATGVDIPRGARACVGIINYDEYLSALGQMNITWSDSLS